MCVCVDDRYNKATGWPITCWHRAVVWRSLLSPPKRIAICPFFPYQSCTAKFATRIANSVSIAMSPAVVCHWSTTIPCVYLRAIFLLFFFFFCIICLPLRYMIHYILILVYLNQNYPLCVIMHMRHDQTVWQSIWTIINCMLHNHCFFFIFVFTVILLRSIKNVHRPSRMDGYIHCYEATKMGHGRWGHQSCIVQSKVIPIQLIALYRTKAQRWFIEDTDRKKKLHQPRSKSIELFTFNIVVYLLV